MRVLIAPVAVLAIGLSGCSSTGGSRVVQTVNSGTITISDQPATLPLERYSVRYSIEQGQGRWRVTSAGTPGTETIVLSGNVVKLWGIGNGSDSSVIQCQAGKNACQTAFLKKGLGSFILDAVLFPITLLRGAFASYHYIDTDKLRSAITEAGLVERLASDRAAQRQYAKAAKERARAQKQRQDRLEEAKNFQQRIRNAQAILSSGVGARVCSERKGRAMGKPLRHVGFVERVENGRVQIRVNNAFIGNSNFQPGGWQPEVIWDSPQEWYLC